MHYYYGIKKQLMEPNWYDEVIPNAFDPSEFEYNESKQEYFMYMGRMVNSKGIDLAIQITKHLGVKLIIGSPGKLSDIGYENVPEHVIEIGYLDIHQRKNLLAHARCLIAPTYYIEPFGNIVVEAGLSGTPVLTTDWGGFSENVAHGVTGYRCKDFNSFIRGAKNIMQGKILSLNCRKYTETNYNLDIVHNRIDAWYKKILQNDFYHVDQ
jgi:glycosyltransferase involved in cell wall biosynthesis